MKFYHDWMSFVAFHVAVLSNMFEFDDDKLSFFEITKFGIMV